VKLTKETENALECLAFLDSRVEGSVVESADVADAIGVSRPFTSKILQRLAKARFVRGHRGNPRGYSLATRAERISVRAVIEALEGETFFQRCIFWSEPCSDTDPCPLHGVWKRVRPKVRSMLSDLSVRDLARKRPFR
jgi:Rrf2 family protein